MKINGELVILNEALTLVDLLENRNYPSDKIAVELNGEIVPRSRYASTILKEADVVEIVCFVGGG